MLVTRNATHTIFMGDGLSDVAAWLKSNPRLWSYAMSEGPSRGGSWDLGASRADAERMASHGWSKGALMMHEGLRAIPAPTTAHAKLRHDVAGHYPDVPRYLSGDPANMVMRGKVQGKKPVLRIVVNLTASGAVNANHYANFGVAVCSMIDKLEASGRRIELDVMFANALRRTRCLAGWRVKGADEPLDLAAVAFSLAHPAAYRRLGFALWERTEALNGGPGYGNCSDLTKEDMRCIDDDDAFIVNGTGMALSACVNSAAAIKFAATQINRAAGEPIVEIDG